MQRSSAAVFALLTTAFAAQACNDDAEGGDTDAALVDAGQAGDTGAPEDDAAPPGEEDVDAGLDAATDSEPDIDAGEPPDADGPQRVTIQFKAKVGQRDFACGETYAGLGTTRVSATPQDFRFFVQDLELVRKGGGTERVQLDVGAPFQNRDVALIDFSDGQGKCKAGGTLVNTVVTGTVPRGEYTGVVFVNGVPESLNHAGTAETATAPLDDISLFWGWLGGYRFLVAELIPELGHSTDAGAPDAGGSDAGPGHASSSAAFVHIGSSGCTGTQAAGFSCSRQARNKVRLEGFDPTKNVVVADLAKVFENIDLQQPLQCHGPAPACAPGYAALGVELSTGNALPSQQVFRFE